MVNFSARSAIRVYSAFINGQNYFGHLVVLVAWDFSGGNWYLRHVVTPQNMVVIGGHGVWVPHYRSYYFVHLALLC